MERFHRSYKELIRLKSFSERYEYLRLRGQVGIDTFGFDRYLNQVVYSSSEWKSFKRKIILRDNGCDLADPDRPILGDRIIVHHINPLVVDDFKNRSDAIFDEDNVVCTSYNTHQAIHYSDSGLILPDFIERKPNDHIPWKEER